MRPSLPYSSMSWVPSFWFEPEDVGSIAPHDRISMNAWLSSPKRMLGIEVDDVLLGVTSPPKNSGPIATDRHGVGPRPPIGKLERLDHEVRFRNGIDKACRPLLWRDFMGDFRSPSRERRHSFHPARTRPLLSRRRRQMRQKSQRHRGEPFQRCKGADHDAAGGHRPQKAFIINILRRLPSG